MLAGQPDPFDASVAHHAIGFVLREFGDVNAAIRELRAALRAARLAGVADREADVLAALAVALVYAGRTSAGFAAFDQAVSQTRGVNAAQILHRRGIALWTLGRYPEALDDLRRALATFRRSGVPVWTGRALTARALVYLAQGSTGQATLDLQAAEQLFAMAGQELESAYSVHNRGKVAYRSGNLPQALACLDEAAQSYASLDVPIAELAIDRCAVLLTAGLPHDALTHADTAIRDIDQVRGQSTMKTELLLAAANAALAAAQPDVALAHALAARRLFSAQGRQWWHVHAGFVVLRARFAQGTVTAQLSRQAELVASQLEALGSPEAVQAHLLAGRVASRLGRTAAAQLHLSAAARHRSRGPALDRVSGWLAEALLAEAAGNTRRLLFACHRGLDTLDAHRLTLGASELRARATAQGAELAELAQRIAVRSGRARLLLTWSERWRATALTVPPVHPGEDPQLESDLAAARDVASRLSHGPVRGAAATALRREQARLEDAIRARVMRAPGPADAAPAQSFDMRALLDQLQDTRLVQIVNSDGVMHVLVCGDGVVRQVTAGQASQAERAVELARFGLRRLAHNRPADNARSAFAILTATGGQLEETLLGDATRHLGDGPVVVVPPGRLHAVPWALLPSLRGRPVSIAPSARAWQRARATVPPPRQRVVLVRGPGLSSDGGEVPQLAKMHDDVTVLGGGNATTSRVLGAVDGAWLAHIAAHGTFRADSPLFSSLLMDDGPLTVYDFERLHRAPYRLVLPSCDSGMLAPAGADELLGLVASLLPLGTAGVVASVVAVNDHVVAPLMVDLHQRLLDGHTLAESLCGVRLAVADDPALLAAAWSLVALGAG